MAERYNRNHIVQSGRFKGYRKDDADDAYWAVGYKLPKLPNYEGWRMRTFCIKCVSDNHINIEKLPTELRALVNIYHQEYGVGYVKDLKTFNIRCGNHQDQSERRCRQCTARRDAARMVLQKKLSIEITHGLLVRTGWQPPVDPVNKIQKKKLMETSNTVVAIVQLPPKNNCEGVEAPREELKEIDDPLRGLCDKDRPPKRDTVKERQQVSKIKGDEVEERFPQAIVCKSSLLGKRPTLKCVKLSPHAIIPTRGTYRAAGHDLYSAHDYSISAGDKMLVQTDLQMAIPPGCYGRIASRSSLTHQHSIEVGAGVIDQDYRGNVGIILFNFGKTDYKVKRGDRCAQLLLEQIYVPFVIEVERLEDTERGQGGFGSTGK